MNEAERLAVTIQRDNADRYLASLGPALKARRVEAKLTLRQLSEQCSVRVDVLQRAETGRWLLTADELDAILAVYGS